MTTIELAPPAAPAPPHLSQGTAIEQSRAVAQVHAAVLVARQYPRDEQRAIRAMQEACARPALAKRAFYEYKRGGQTVTGPTIKLLQELGRIWGNLDFGMAELSIDHAAGQSEMLAHAWDLESNARFSQIVIVQHVRDKNVNGAKVAEQLSDRRDVYDANTSNAARRLRECIRRVIPDWFVEEAEARCLATLENPGDGLTHQQRIARIVRGFENAWGVDQRQLETRVGKPLAEWTPRDVAQLSIVGDSIKDGSLTVDDAFPRRVTAAEVASTTKRTAPAPAAAEQAPVDAPPTTEEPPAPEQEHAPPRRPDGDRLTATKPQVTKVNVLLAACRVTDRDQRLETLALIVGHRLVSSNDLTRAEASTVIDLLEPITNSENPIAALDLVLAELANSDPEAGA